jgi:hypothetical protein
MFNGRTISVPFITLILGSFLIFSFRSDCGTAPALNQGITAFVKTTIGKKIGRGECWDLAAEALNANNASWDGKFGFGLPIDPKKDCVFPGDVIQFKNVRVAYRKGNTFYEEEMDQHTALVYEVREKGKYVVAEQNTSRLGRKVGLNDFELENIRKGKTQFFRPQAK